MIEFRNVSKSYVRQGIRKPLFDDLSFRMPAGSVAIMGPNGAGKSTMMRLVAGVELPNRGRVIRDERISWPLGFSSGFNGSMTGIENIRFVARIYGQDTRSVIDYVEDFAGLGPSLRLPVRGYSSGMKARLAFGLSMAIEFDTYLIDEITAVGDDEFRRKCQAVFESRLNRSRVIMISHSAATIRSYCDCGLLVRNGRVTYYSEVDSLIEAYHALFETAG